MTLADRLTDDERVAGVALVHEHSALAQEEAPEHLKNHRARRAVTTAHVWAQIRGLPSTNEDELAFAMVDALSYMMGHRDDVARFSEIRDMQRRIN